MWSVTPLDALVGRSARLDTISGVVAGDVLRGFALLLAAVGNLRRDVVRRDGNGPTRSGSGWRSARSTDRVMREIVGAWPPC